MHLTRLIYYSENRLDAADGPVLGALQQILATSKRNNAAHGITGALAADSFWFFQALEGEREAVWSTFTRIMEDARHGEVMLAGFVPIETRLFGAWSMRLITRAAEAASLLAPFTRDGVLRPGLMRETDIANALLAMIIAVDRPPTTSPHSAEKVGRDALPRAAAIAP